MKIAKWGISHMYAVYDSEISNLNWLGIVKHIVEQNALYTIFYFCIRSYSAVRTLKKSEKSGKTIQPNVGRSE